MRKLCIHALLAAAALAMTAGTALAHAALRHAVPAAGAVLNQAPDEITLEFSEAIDVSRLELKLTPEGGAPIELTAPEAQARSTTTVRRAIGATLAPGTYHIFWRVISIDGHWTRGDYTFEIAAP